MESDLTQVERDELREALPEYISYLEAKLAALKVCLPLPTRAPVIAAVQGQLMSARTELLLAPPAGDAPSAN